MDVHENQMRCGMDQARLMRTHTKTRARGESGGGYWRLHQLGWCASAGVHEDKGCRGWAGLSHSTYQFM